MDTLKTTSTLKSLCFFVLPETTIWQPEDLSQIDELESESCAAFPEWIRAFASTEPIEPEEFETIFNWFIA